MTLVNLPRQRIAHLPTPVEPLPRLSQALGGPSIWVKRDDQTGLAFGGNKTRKLEFLLADARSLGAETLITRGALQSNHCRQTAAAAARHGYACTLILAGEAPSTITGNLLLDQLLGAEIIFAGDEDPEQVLKQAFDRAQEEGRRPYLIPYGGSSPTGASAYVAALEELLTEEAPFHRIVFATSSGGTQAGMIVGAQALGLPTRIYGISVDKPADDLRPAIAALAHEIADLLRIDLALDSSDILVDDRYLGGGYGVMGDPEVQAIRLFARHEGLLLDPVYTGRAAAGLIDLIHRGEIEPGERILFWHTGGTPGLFAYADQLKN